MPEITLSSFNIIKINICFLLPLFSMHMSGEFKMSLVLSHICEMQDCMLQMRGRPAKLSHL